MSDDPQPEAVWVFPDDKRNRGRIWLLVILGLAVVAMVVALLWFFLPRADDPSPTPTPTPTATSSATPTPSPSPTATPTTPPTPPPAPDPDPDLEGFRAEVQPRLDDAVHGLDMVAGEDSSFAISVVESLQIDAAWLAGVGAAPSIADAWYAAVPAYGSALDALRAAYENGAAPDAALGDATAALNDLRALVGL